MIFIINPGVLTLASLLFDVHNYRVEDNIGEAIHIHIDGLRLDLTVKQFLNLSQDAKTFISKIITARGFKLSYIDSIMFLANAHHLAYLEYVEFDEVYLDNLSVPIVDGSTIVAFKPITGSMVYSFLNGNSDLLNHFFEINLYGKSNAERVRDVLQRIYADGYPYDDKYIILFNDSNVIEDGQHRASCLRYIYGNIKVKVLRFYFHDTARILKCDDLVHREPINEFCSHYKTYYIYGIGSYGRAVYRMLKRRNINVDGFMVTEKKGKSEFLSLPLYIPEEAPVLPSECGIILGLNEHYHWEVLNCLRTNSFLNYYRFLNYEMQNFESGNDVCE